MPTKATKKTVRTKLTKAKAGQIRTLAAKLDKKGKTVWSQRKLAEKFNVSRSCIFDVLSGKTWNA